MEGQPLSFSSSAPPPPHKFPGATSALLPGPGAPCALNWKKKKKPALNKEQPVLARPGPVGASPPPASLRERGARHPAGEAGSAGDGRRLWPGQRQSPLQAPDPSLHPAGLLWPGKYRWRRETRAPLVELAPSAKGMSWQGSPSSAACLQQDPHRGSVGREVTLE